jgi:hypothetical protein
LRSPVSYKPLDGNLLRAPIISDERVKHYGVRYHIKTQHEVVRHEKDIGFDLIHGSCQKIEEAVDLVVKRATSDDPAELQKQAHTKADLYSQFDGIRPHLSRRQKEMIPDLSDKQLKSYSKKALVTVLVRLRKAIYRRKPEVKLELEQAARASMGAAKTSKETRQATLQHVHYSGHGCSAFQKAEFQALTEL